MAINLFYECTTCDFQSSSLEDAQRHADEREHTISIEGTLTARPNSTANILSIEQAAARKAREAAILRAARDRNLLPKTRGGGR